MDYKEKYNKAIVHLRKFLDGDCVIDKEILEDFPELRESEDERIRKALIDGVRQIRCKGNVTQEQMLAYLEKQKDKMTAEEYESSELFQLKLKTKYANGYQDGLAQKEQNTAEWSEEDEEMLNSCISSIEESKENRYAYKETDGDTSYDHEIDWLKSLRPHWKPSEEQIYSLGAVVKGYNECNVGSVGYNLKELYEQLKKL